MKKSYINFLLSAIIGIALLYCLVRYFGVREIFFFIKQANAASLTLAFLLVVIAYGIRGFRWIIWERELNYWDSLGAILVGFMGNNILPARLGELLRAHCAAQKIGIRRGRTALLASVAAERILDGLILSVFGILGLIFVTVDKYLCGALLFVSGFFAILTVCLIASICFHLKIRILLERLNGASHTRLIEFATEKVNFLLDGLLPLGSFWCMAKALAVTVLIWAIELLSYYLIANAVWAGVSLQKCLIFLAVVNFASLFPFTVGGIGAIEGATTVFLISAGIPAQQSAAMVLIQHACQYFFTTISGAGVYFLGKFYKAPAMQPMEQTAKNNLPEETAGCGPVLDAPACFHESEPGIYLGDTSTDDVVLSIVIPAYNEERRLPKTVAESVKWCEASGITYELVISDDGSRDRTLPFAKQFSQRDKNVKVVACPHMGKGAAVRMGMLNACGAYVLFMDADGATPLSEIPKLISAVEKGHDVALGSRALRDSDETVVEIKWYRSLIGRTFNFFVSVFAVKGIVDTQCGFKMFRNQVVRDVFLRQKLKGFAFDVEILFIAKRLNLSICEIPVNWVNQEGSKVNIVTDSIKMLRDIICIRWLHKFEDWKTGYGLILDTRQSS